jgi:hypothetical protein
MHRTQRPGYREAGLPRYYRYTEHMECCLHVLLSYSTVCRTVTSGPFISPTARLTAACNRHITQQLQRESTMPLKVLVVGAGLVGLCAAISLARQGHNVHIYEKSGFAKEIGAAFSLSPQAHKILKDLGVDTGNMEPCTCDLYRFCDDLSVGAEYRVNYVSGPAGPTLLSSPWSLSF